MLLRCVTGFILMAIGIWVIALGGLSLLIAIAIVSAGLNEEIRRFILSHDKKTSQFLWVGSIASLVIVLSPLFINVTEIAQHSISKLILAGFFLVLLIELMKQHVFGARSFIVTMIRMMGFSTCLLFVFLMRDMENGLFLTLYTFLMIWTTDIMALFGGKCYGKHQLSPISPNKTIEGSLTAIFVTTFTGMVFAVGLGWPILTFAILSFLISIIGQIGDLHESLTKRYIGIKDSSQILPGHGGLYDRFDSTIFVMPILYYLFGVML